MTRSRNPILAASWMGLLMLASLADAQTPPTRSDPTATARPTSEMFVEGLRARGYHDLASEYLKSLRDDPTTSPERRSRLEYEIARGMLDEAASLTDLDRRRALLEEARVALDAFVAKNPEHELVEEALTQLARMLHERGLTAAIQAAEATVDDDNETPARKAELSRQRGTRLAEARASYGDARAAYDLAIERLGKELDSFDKALFDKADQPKKLERDRVQVALMDAQLQRALVDYDDAQTYPPGDPARNELLETARGRFKPLYDRYRTYLAGFFAHMWEGKCYEEQGKLREAMGIYNELMDQPAAMLDPLKRKVAYFQVIIDGKRGDHALAVERALAWLRTYPNAIRTDEGTGIRFELAKNLLAQVPKFSGREKTAATNQAVDLLSDVVRYYSPFKPEAIELLRTYKPSLAMQAEQISRMTFEEASREADAALATQDWPRATALLRQAIRQADPSQRVDDANRARYLLAYCYYMDKRYVEAAILADHLVRHYPQGGLSSKAAEIGLASLTSAYNTNQDPDRIADLERLVRGARDIVQTYPESDQGDAARFLLGEIALGRGRYAEAAEAFESVREGSARRLEALTRAGDAHWRLAVALRSQNKPAESEREATAARSLLDSVLAARRSARTPLTDPGYIASANALAEIHRAENRPEKAIELLDPIAQSFGSGEVSEELAALRIATLTILLRAHVATGQSDAAIANMKALVATGGSGAMLTQLYFELGRSLKREIDALEDSDDPLAPTRGAQMREAYRSFLEALAESESGQTYDSLMFAGESLLGLGVADRAGQIFSRVLETYGKLAEFQKSEDSRLARARLRRAEALRKQGIFAEAQTLIDEVATLEPRLLEARMERGYLIEDRAIAQRQSTRSVDLWKESYDYWKELADQLQRGRPRRIEYYEALYHVAVALEGMNQTSKAIATLKGVMTLSPTVGNPTLKSKYEAMIARLAPAIPSSSK